MAITTLLSVMLIGGSAVQVQRPTILEIYTKCYAVTSPKEFKAEGKKIAFKKLSGGDSVMAIEGFDEDKLTKQAGLKILSAPTIRTLDGRAASLTFTMNAGEVPATHFSVGYQPAVQADGKINLGMKLAEKLVDSSQEIWSFETSAVMGRDSHAWLVRKNRSTMLYIVNARVMDPVGG